MSKKRTSLGSHSEHTARICSFFRFLRADYEAQTALLRTVRNSAAIPISSTPPSSFTDTPCSRSNSARSGLHRGVAATDPICARSTSIRAITTRCETSVMISMRITPMAAGRASAPSDLASATEATR